MGQKVVKNYPSPRLMETIGATNQKPPEAIGELVANCFDARFGNEKLDIVIDTRDDKIVVLDNGKGMTIDILEKAVCIAEDMSRHIERGEGAKGHFGMGFKTSCSTLGNYYDIYTRPSGSNKEYHVAFDIADYSIRPSGSDAWDVVIEDNDISNESVLGDAEHGTAFVISKLKTNGIALSAILQYLGEAFKAHLEAGDSIKIIEKNGEHEATPVEYNFITGTEIAIDELFGDDNKYHITGWVALDKQTHNDGKYGFNIYRNKQLVVTFEKSWFAAHLMTSRIIGEVNMDFLDATFYKQGVQQSEDWKIVSQHMKEYLKPIVAASRDISRKQNIRKPGELKRIVNELNDNYSTGVTVEEDDYSGTTNNNTPTDGNSSPASVNDKIKNVVKEESLVLEDIGEIQITYMVKEGGNVKSPFDYIFSEAEDDEEKSELQVLMFMDHPLWEKKTDSEVIKILATSDAIYRMLVEKLGIDTSEAHILRNEWVNTRLDKKKE